jgi:hypothetical protein
MNDLAKPLRYLIGADEERITPRAKTVTVGPYDAPPIGKGPNIAYCNLFHENLQTEGPIYEPYLKDTDTSAKYSEGRIDPDGDGWRRNLSRQLALRVRQGHRYVEFDNVDAYEDHFDMVILAIEWAVFTQLGVIAKNPLLLEDTRALTYMRHFNVVGAIVERDPDISPGAAVARMDGLRIAVGKMHMPVWFVTFDDRGVRAGLHWAKKCARAAAGRPNMWVSHSAGGEYTRSVEVKL